MYIDKESRMFSSIIVARYKLIKPVIVKKHEFMSLTLKLSLVTTDADRIYVPMVFIRKIFLTHQKGTMCVPCQINLSSLSALYITYVSLH